MPTALEFQARHSHIVDPNKIIAVANDPRTVDLFRVDAFFAMLASNPSFGKGQFTWTKKKIPAVILYLLWRGFAVQVPEEEIREAERLGQPDKKVHCFSQYHHGYADLGFDVRTVRQFRDLNGDISQTAGEHRRRADRGLPRGGLVLLSAEPGPKAKTRAVCTIDPLDWPKRLAEFSYNCACCGNKEGTIGRSGLLVKLERGHTDSRKPWSHQNVIPQCGSCNNHRDDEVYGPSKEDPSVWVVVEKFKRT